MKKIRRLTRAIKVARNKAGKMSKNSKYAKKQSAQRKGIISERSPFFAGRSK